MYSLKLFNVPNKRTDQYLKAQFKWHIPWSHLAKTTFFSVTSSHFVLSIPDNPTCCKLLWYIWPLHILIMRVEGISTHFWRNIQVSEWQFLYTKMAKVIIVILVVILVLTKTTKTREMCMWSTVDVMLRFRVDLLTHTMSHYHKPYHKRLISILIAVCTKLNCVGVFSPLLNNL